LTEEDEKTKLEQAIAALESQRGILGNAVVETALGPLREKLEALAARPDPEQRKLVTVLFADLVGFTAMSERLDPEDVRQIQQAYFAEITRPVMERRGNVEKYIGDALLAVFSLVQAQEDDPDQAVLAALGMQTALADLNQSLESKTGVKLEQPLQMRVGVNTGLVVVGMRSEGDFVVTGDTVNLASRLQNAAPPGGVLIANDTYRHVRGAFDLQPLEPLTVKGKHDSVQVYRVMAAKPRSFRTRRRGVEGIATRMIGREPELKTLQNAYLAMIEDGERQMVTIVGEPGLGKSRLLYEFENWVDLLPEKVMLFRGRARQETRMLPHRLLRDIFSLVCRMMTPSRL
jgi:class 3 adenylate cyclase